MATCSFPCPSPALCTVAPPWQTLGSGGPDWDFGTVFLPLLLYVQQSSSVGCCRSLDDRIAETPSILNQAWGAASLHPNALRMICSLHDPKYKITSLCHHRTWERKSPSLETSSSWNRQSGCRGAQRVP